MLLALWPAILSHSQWISAGREHETVTQRAIRAKDISKRKAAIQATMAPRRLPEANDGSIATGNTDGALDIPSIPGSIESVGNATIRIPRYERALSGRIPEALGTSLATSDALQYAALDQAMKRYSARQAADEDDEIAMIIILAGM